MDDSRWTIEGGPHRVIVYRPSSIVRTLERLILMKQRYWRRGLAAAALVCALLATAWPAGATNLRFAHPAFQALWARTDQLVADHSVSRSWLWGPNPGLVWHEA